MRSAINGRIRTRDRRELPSPALRTRRFSRGEVHVPGTEFPAAFRLTWPPRPGFAPVLEPQTNRSAALPSVRLRGLATRQTQKRDPCGLSRRRPPLPRSARRARPHLAFAPGRPWAANPKTCLLLPAVTRQGRERRPWTTGNGISPRPRCPRQNEDRT